MKLKWVHIGITLLVLLLLFACEENSVKEEETVANNILEYDFSDMLEANISVDSLFIQIKGSEVLLRQTFTDLEAIGTLNLAISIDSDQNLTLKAILYYNSNFRDCYTIYHCSSEESSLVIGKIKADYYHQNIILTIQNIPDTEVLVADLYNLSVLDYFFKEYHIDNIDAKADVYSATPMNFLMEHGIQWSILDENMIPVVHYPYGDYYNSVTTCNNAFGCYDQYTKTGNEDYLEMFYANVEWIINYRDDASFLRYEFDFTHETVTLTEGWTSAMAQGQALALMSIAYHNSGNDRYLQAANEFFVTMHTNNSECWNVYIDENDYLWYEEYPSSDFCHVLNGKLFSMWGLWEYYCISRNDDAKRLLQGAIASILDHYPIWDIDGVDGSRYCKHKTTVSSYHWIHKAQIEEYRDMFDIPEFDVFLKTITNQQ